MPHTEPTVNAALAGLLRPMFAGGTVAGEDTGGVSENPSLRLDALITAPGRSPVSIEAEFMPARTVEDDATARLGLTARRDNKTIEAALAVRYPERLRDDRVDIDSELGDARLSYAVYTLEGPRNAPRHARFPESGWLEGDVGDLANLARLVSTSQRTVDDATTNLETGINAGARILGEMDTRQPGVNIEVARELGMENGEQTRRMACAIITNALIFHERMVGMLPELRLTSLRGVAGADVLDPQGRVLDAWREILHVNYFPIFHIARRVLTQLPAAHGSHLIRVLSQTAWETTSTGIDNAHDLTGRVFQRLIADRKYLATFYTRPASAALLAQLAIAKLQGVDWSSADDIGRLRIADFACGTGALLSATYEQIASRYARTGGDSRNLHTTMMEDVLIGCDVMPSAVHITASTLAGIEPVVPYGSAKLYTMFYGRQPNDDVQIGSLEFLAADSVLTNTREGGTSAQMGDGGEETPDNVFADVPDGSLDLVIMNPPFTRAGSDWEGANRDEDYVKQFRGLSTALDTQKEMSERLRRFTRNTAYHGYAGIASAFVALADKKLKPGGALALVLPISAAAGMSWQSFRRLIGRSYTDVEVLTITSNGGGISFSADTNIAECLVIATKNDGAGNENTGRFASLERRPRDMMQASVLADAITGITAPRSIDDGPYGGTAIMVGEQPTGELMALPVTRDGDIWGTVRLLDGSVAQTAHALSESRLWLPGNANGTDLPIAALSEVGHRGWHDINIASSSGPFTRTPPRPTATYPALWSHDAKRETRLVCEPDTELRVKQGQEARASEAWATAGRAHLSKGFRFNSQPLSAAYTATLSLGGGGWPNVNFANEASDKGFILWSNSTLGLVSYWWHANRQQSGRGMMTVTSMDSLPVLDFRGMSDEQLAAAERIFEEFSDKDLMPAYLADADPNRDLLDRRVVMDMLGFDEDVYRGVRRLAQKWCAEPSVHGGKARPRDARPILGDSSLG